MEEIIPWSNLIAVIEPFYPKGGRGRPPVGLERMLRMYFLQQWYGLADEALEDAIYDSQAMRGFTRIDLGSDSVPDATTLLKFRHLLETNDLCKSLFTAINADLEAMNEGPEKETLKAAEKAKASVRAFVEHPFHVIKNLFGYRKTRYRGLAKNGHQFHPLFGLANLVIAARPSAA